MSRLKVRTTILGDGRVLVAGSDNVCTLGSAWEESVIVDIGDPLAGTWTIGPDLPRPRDRFFLATLPDGSALVVAGATDGDPNFQAFSSSFRLADGGNEWERSGDLGVARAEPAGAVLEDGRVLLAGGAFVDGRIYRALDSAELYDPATGAWSQTGSLRETAVGASAVTLSDGRVLLRGRGVASASIFDPRTEEWSAAGTFPESAIGAPLVALRDGGALLVDPDGAYRFDAATRSWSATARMLSTADERTVVALADGRVLVAGGSVGDGGQPEDFDYIKRSEIYDPDTDRWDATARLPAGRAGAAGLLLEDGSVVLVGGSAVPPQNQGAPNCPQSSLDVFRFLPD